MDNSGKEPGRAPFQLVWGSLPGRDQLESIGTMETLRCQDGAAPIAVESLPQVGHLASLGGALGRGGQGEVLSADQIGLDRKIAIKRTQSDASEDVASALLREARVIGYLEHPNIPPIHYAGTSDENALIIALKKIEGETLAHQLKGAPDFEKLDERLDILIQVTNAVRFAHNRGILHLDLKPANVMMGRYGEVYVVDWGLAVAFRDDLPTGMPRPLDDGPVYGTPAFIAPETIQGETATPATDVYQLGGILHCLLTGSPPNSGDTTFEVLRSSYEPEPRIFSEEVPKTLAQICKKALEVGADKRFADANEFREALVSYRRDLRELEASATAQERMDALHDALAKGSEDAALVYQSFGRARQAIDEWAELREEDSNSQTMLQEALEALIRWELNRQEIGSAAFFLHELPTKNEALTKAVEEQERNQADQREELRSLRWQADPSIGRVARLVTILTLGLAIALSELVPFVLGLEVTAERVMISNAIYLVFLLGISYRYRKEFFATRVNRTLLLFVWVLSLNGSALRVGSLLELLPLSTMAGYDLLLVTMMNAVAVLLIDRRLRFSVVTYALFTIACFVWPSVTQPLYGAAHLVGLSIIGLAMTFIEAPTPKT